MKTSRSHPLFGLLLAVLFAAAGPLSRASDSLLQKQVREEFKQAERAATNRLLSGESVQRELDRLQEEKALWEREIVYSKSKLANATAQFDHFSTIGAQDEILKWKHDAGNWQGRLKAAIVELDKVESEIQERIVNLQKALQADTSNLLLEGESVEVFVTEDESFNGLYQIRRGGYIIMPRVGRIYVAGKDLAGAEKAVKEALQKDQLRETSVLVERPLGIGAGIDGAVIYLAGEFRNPGAWKIPSGVSPTVVNTVLRSGGLTEAADLTKVRVLRLVSGQPLVEEVNVSAILDGAGLASDLSLNAGDIVMVPPYANVVYVTGNVMKPAALKLLPDEELTAYSAILRCGGFSRFASRKKVYVLRDHGDGIKEKLPVNIDALQSGRGSDIILRSKDIIVVPEKFFSF